MDMGWARATGESSRGFLKGESDDYTD